MIVECPNCHVKYKLPDTVKPGAKLKCSKCKHLFVYTPEEDLAKEDRPKEEQADLKEEQAAQGQKDSAAKANLDLDDASDLNFEDEEDKKPEIGASKDKSYQVEIEDQPSKKKGKKDKKSFKKLVPILLVFLLMVLLGGAGYLYFPQLMALKEKFFPSAAKLSSGKVQSKNVEEKVKNIALENVKQYFVKNSRIGELFVIEGEAVNNFKQTKELIKLRAKILDKNGKVAAQKDFLAGNTASLFQLQMMTKDELENLLNSKVGILTNNTFVKPGGRVPFMVVFYDLPPNVQEFSLQVIDVKNPPKKK